MTEPRELLCMICGKEHGSWHAPNELWNRVMRGLDAIARYDTNALRDWLTDRGIASPDVSNEPPSFERHVVAVSAEMRRLLRQGAPAPEATDE